MNHGGNIWELIRKGVGFEQIMDFSASINPFGPPDWVQAAIHDNIKFIRHYPDPEQRELRAHLSDFLGIKEEYIIAGNGATEAIYLLANLLQGKNILIPSPTFSEYETALTANNAVLKFPIVKESNGFCFPYKEVLNELSWADAVWICNPNNPTGKLIEPSLLIALLDNAIKTNTLVIVDESFLMFVASSKDDTTLNVIDNYPNLIVISSLTKFFAIPGIRIGYMATSNTAILNKLKRQMPPWGVNIFAQIIVPGMLLDEGFMFRSRGLIEEARDEFFRELSELKTLRVYPSAANFFLIKLCGNTKADRLSQQLAQDNILIRNCSNLRGLDDTYIRVSVMREEQNKILVKELRDSLEIGQ
ncbi:aminotransferase class I/II-fold pyridoxal phosphate-dependent enzyme [bacterium]|nr:aminotransferase class I/II-fold pyridoxal phosphate-dependent enzyme [bacterium]MBU1754559.1 aminotransferase class I/II-fold pyridoxal phosphate-dependent enzyme [bacterium]